MSHNASTFQVWALYEAVDRLTSWYQNGITYVPHLSFLYQFALDLNTTMDWDLDCNMLISVTFYVNRNRENMSIKL